VPDKREGASSTAKKPSTGDSTDAGERAGPPLSPRVGESCIGAGSSSARVTPIGPKVPLLRGGAQGGSAASSVFVAGGDRGRMPALPVDVDEVADIVRGRR